MGDLRILGVPLAERQERVARALGLSFAGEVDAPGGGDDDALYWDDDVDVSVSALRAFLKASPSGGRMAMLERPLRRGDLEVEPPGPLWKDEPTRLIGVRRGGSTEPVVVPPRGFGGVTRLPGPFKSDVNWWLTARTATTVRHWSHLLRANLTALAPAMDAAIVRSPWNVLWSWMRSPLRAGGGRLASIGKRCRIHPTARLEMCILGDDVQVGAYSVLRGCFLGDGAVVEDHATCRGTIVEPGAHLGNYCMLNLCVLGAGSSISHIGGQATIVGRDTFVSTFCTMQDLNLMGNVKVMHEGALVDTGGPFLGCAVGHRVRLGIHVLVAPGRAIPNDVTLVSDPGGVLARIPEDTAPGLYTVRAGALAGR